MRRCLAMLVLGLPLLVDAAEVDGAASFVQKCAACHTIGKGQTVGPDLKGVTARREQDWLVRWIMHPDKMLAEKDPIATDLLKQFNGIPMPPQGIAEEEARALLAYIAAQSAGEQTASADAGSGRAEVAGPAPIKITGIPRIALVTFLAIMVFIMLVFLSIGRSARSAQPLDMKSAYRLRARLFVGAVLIVAAVLAFTLPQTPYPDFTQTPERVIHMAGNQYSFMFFNEPVTRAEDLAQIHPVALDELPADKLLEFRVTSLDVNHGFAIYSPDGQLFAQTQAMPGYINRLRVRFKDPGRYNIFCLEYCGAGHHLMRSELVVR